MRAFVFARRPPAASAAGLKATSVKRPHWVLLGFDDSLARGGGAPAVSRVQVHDTALAVFRTPAGDPDAGELRVALDACPHRGASLAAGGGRVGPGGCARCAYHGRGVSLAAHPDRFFDYAVQDGLVWLDYGSHLLTQHHAPPAYPEHSDPALRTFGYTKRLALNPVLMTENTLDWQHLASVHRVHFIEGAPEVTIRSRGPHGRAEYKYRSELFDLTIDNEYHVPFTTSLRFRFRRRGTGEELPPLLLWFSLTPGAGNGEIELHLRVSRGVLTHPLADWIFRLIDELPLLEDAAVVSTVDPLAWSANRLDRGDEFVAAYRAAMADSFPEVLRRYVA